MSRFLTKIFKKNKGLTPYSSLPARTGSAGFTLIELLIVIGILGVLATTVVMVINPAQMMKQSRDGTRMAELQSINKALLVYQSFGGSSSMGTSNTIYISLPDSDSQCGSYYGTLAATSSPWNYHCSPEVDYRKTDGTGWVPVDFTSVESSSGSLFASLPIDPTNTATNELYYTYIPGSWALSTTMESTKYLAANATADGGQSSTRFEVGNELVLNNVLTTVALPFITYNGNPLYIYPTDNSTGANWGCKATIIGETAQSETLGADNTTAIVAACSTEGIAAKLCSDLDFGDYTDWYLPAKDQLNAMYTQKNTVDTTNYSGSPDWEDFTGFYYWSSTEYSPNPMYYAWNQNFGNGSQVNGDKDYTSMHGYVRCVR